MFLKSLEEFALFYSYYAIRALNYSKSESFVGDLL